MPNATDFTLILFEENKHSKNIAATVMVSFSLWASIVLPRTEVFAV